MIENIYKTNYNLIVSISFLTDNTLNIKEKSIYMILLSYCKEGNKWCNPSINTDLRISTGLAPKTIISSLKKLEEKGYILIEKQCNSLGKLLSNKYILLK